MGKVKLGLNRLSVLERIALAGKIVTSMTGNPNFVTPVPALADITAKTTVTLTANDDAQIQRQQAKTATEVLADAAKDLDKILIQAALYVENISGGDEAKILSAGMSVKDVATPVGPLSAPTDLYAEVGGGDGEIDLNWKPVFGAKSYLIQMTTDPNVPDSWAFKRNSTESFTAITGLTSGTKYWFRVAAVGAAGQGDFSDPAAKYAP
jgi:hypothetical protein